MPYSEYIAESPELGVCTETSPEEFYRLGLIYSTGIGVAIDYIAAHKWFNLAAQKGYQEARESRASIAEMMTADDIRTAQRAAREWISQARSATRH